MYLVRSRHAGHGGWYIDDGRTQQCGSGSFGGTRARESCGRGRRG